MDLNVRMVVGASLLFVISALNNDFLIVQSKRRDARTSAPEKAVILMIEGNGIAPTAD